MSVESWRQFWLRHHQRRLEDVADERVILADRCARDPDFAAIAERHLSLMERGHRAAIADLERGAARS